MSDNRDIEAREASPEELRLLDLLYGEVEGDDADAIRAELEADSARADDLSAYSELRELFRELPSEEPPQAVSARLLHAAAEQAPASGRTAAAAAAMGGGFWNRLLGFFRPLVANPAIAAAAMFILVAGVAGTLYMTGKVDVAEPELERAEPASPAASGDEAAPELPSQMGRGARLDMGIADEGEAEPADQPPAEPTTIDGIVDSNAADDRLGGEKERQAEPSRTRASSSSTGKKDRKPSRDMAPGGFSGAAGNSPMIDADDDFDKAPTKRPPPPPAKPRPTAKADPAPAPQQVLVEEESAPVDEQKKSESSAATQLRALHDRARQAAADGECEAVSSLGARIRKLDPRYYDSTYRRDKALASCFTAVGK